MIMNVALYGVLCGGETAPKQYGRAWGRQPSSSAPQCRAPLGVYFLLLFAVVYKADLQGHGTVAFKVLLPVSGRSGEIFTRMFIREAQAGYKLEHP